MNIRQAFTSLLGLADDSWASWRALICGAFGCQLSAQEAETFRLFTQRSPLTAPCRELWLAIGRRGGKNRVSAAIAIFLALFKRWRLAPGEVGTVLVLASDRIQAKVGFRYVRGLLESDPTLWHEVANVTADTIQLRSGIEIAIGTADNAAVRGRTIVAAICDEFAFWPHEDAQEVLRALRPGMATQPEAMLIVISSVYAAYGPFYEARRRYFGSDDPRILYAVATSQQLNPTLSDEFIAAELDRDPVGNAAEYLSVERTDTAAFIDAALLEGNTRSSPRELPHIRATINGTPTAYHAAADISGGRNDATAAAVAHRDGDRVIVDACRRWPAPHDPKVVAKELAAFLASYGLRAARADQYGAELSRSLYSEAGVTLTAAPDNKSETYLRLLPLLTSGRVELPPDPRLRSELLGLERRTRSGGKDIVDHRQSPGAHDDLANAVALAAVAASKASSEGLLSVQYNEHALLLQSDLGWFRREPFF